MSDKLDEKAEPVTLTADDQRLLEKALMASTEKLYDITSAPAAMPGEEERFTAAYLGFNPHDASTWDADVVNRLARIRSEQGDQAFVQAVANLTTPSSAGIGSVFNACCHREECRALEARALAAEAALAKEKGNAARYQHLRANFLREPHLGRLTWYLPTRSPLSADALDESIDRNIAAAIRAQGE